MRKLDLDSDASQDTVDPTALSVVHSSPSQHHLIPAYPIPAHPIPSPFHPIPAHPSRSHHIPSHPISSHPSPAHSSLSKPIPAYSITSNPMPSHPSSPQPIQAHPITGCTRPDGVVGRVYEDGGRAIACHGRHVGRRALHGLEVRVARMRSSGPNSRENGLCSPIRFHVQGVLAGVHAGGTRHPSLSMDRLKAPRFAFDGCYARKPQTPLAEIHSPMCHRTSCSRSRRRCAVSL